MNEDRPMREETVGGLRERVDAIRAELAHRKTSLARRLREEIDPDYSIDRPRNCCVYVIELAESVRSVPGFQKKNPDASRDRTCLYVGSTWLTPAERLQEHRDGGRNASAGPRDHGVRLRPEFYERFHSMTRDEAEGEEAALADLLRREGYGVWQG